MSTPNTAVHMLRPSLADIPQHAFPPGYSIRAMKRGDEALWTDVQRDAEPYLKIEDGLFAAEFGGDWALIGQRCFLILNPRGATSGTISAWRSENFKGGSWGRIHWVAVRPSAQGQGLAKAGLTFALNVLAQHHRRAWLATSSARLNAIKLYLDFGFVPDLELSGAEAAWREIHAALGR